MSVKQLTERHLEFPSLKRACKGSSESTLVKMPHCWKSHVAAHLLYLFRIIVVIKCPNRCVLSNNVVLEISKFEKVTKRRALHRGVARGFTMLNPAKIWRIWDTFLFT